MPRPQLLDPTVKERDPSLRKSYMEAKKLHGLQVTWHRHQIMLQKIKIKWFSRILTSKLLFYTRVNLVLARIYIQIIFLSQGKWDQSRCSVVQRRGQWGQLFIQFWSQCENPPKTKDLNEERCRPWPSPATIWWDLNVSDCFQPQWDSLLTTLS